MDGDRPGGAGPAGRHRPHRSRGRDRGAAAWTPKPAPTTTPWTNQVPVDHPLPEYPRPQLTRPDWANLNGVWDFAVTSADAGRPAAFPEQIRVPFVAESALSGIQRRGTQSDGGRDRSSWRSLREETPLKEFTSPERAATSGGKFTSRWTWLASPSNSTSSAS